MLIKPLQKINQVFSMVVQQEHQMLPVMPNIKAAVFFDNSFRGGRSQEVDLAVDLLVQEVKIIDKDLCILVMV